MGKRAVGPKGKVYRTTFTFFIPAPPIRKNGYREVEYDKVMRGLFDSGFELESLQTQTSPNGIFLIAVLKTKNKKIFESDSGQDFHENFKLSHTHSSPDIILEEEDV